ncbi:MAG: type II toxin-antitoxin system VapC family toxin [Egibacteraceae bacterium]
MLLDTAVFVYAVGVAHPYQAACVTLIAGVRDRRFRGEASALAIQELLHQRARRTGDRKMARQTARDAADLCPIHDLTTIDLDVGLRLFGDCERLGAIDALHAATAINRGIPVIVSPDKAFDEVPGLVRIDPVDAAALL